MTNLYVLMCEVWCGNGYSKEVVYSYKDKELCMKTAAKLQAPYKESDVRYWCEEVGYSDWEDSAVYFNQGESV